MNPVNPPRRGAARHAFLLLACAAMLLSNPAFGQSNRDWRPPAFSAEGADGSQFSFPEDLDRPTVVLFWASWCPYCKALMPHLQSLLDEYPGRLRVLSLAIKDDGDPAAVLAEYGYDFVLIPSADAVAETWGVKGVPGLYLATAEGRIVFDRLRIPAAESESEPPAAMKHYQKAARSAPRWAAHLRIALDELLDAP